MTMKVLLQEKRSDVPHDGGNHLAGQHRPFVPTTSVEHAEQEADHVADAVMHPGEAAFQAAELEHLPSIKSAPNDLLTGGSPLPKSARELVNPHLGFDFSRVRIHANPDAAS